MRDGPRRVVCDGCCSQRGDGGRLVGSFHLQPLVLPAEHPEELRCHLVDSNVGALGRKKNRNKQRIGIPVIQGNARLWEKLIENEREQAEKNARQEELLEKCISRDKLFPLFGGFLA